MSDYEILQSVLHRTARRQRFERGWVGLWRGLLWGSLLCVTGLVLYKVFPVPFAVPLGGALLLPMAALAGWIYGWSQQPTLDETARFLDAKENLNERLSTALEISKVERPGNWKDLLLADAARNVKNLDPRQLIPYYLPKASRWALLVILVGATLGFVPEYRSKSYLQGKQEEANLKETGKQLLELTRHNLEHRTPALEPTQKALHSVEELSLEMSKAALTRNAALQELNSLTDKLKEQMKELGKNAMPKSLEKAARDSSQSGPAPGSAELQKQIDSLQQSLGPKASDPGGMDKLKDKLDKAQQAAANLPNKDNAEGQQAREQLGKTLAELASQAKELGQTLPGLNEAIEALKAGKIDQLVMDLNEASTDLEKLQDMAKTLQQMQQQAAKLGKDLAEQLKFGQAEAAQKTLEKMVEQLKTAGLSQEELKKLTDEVSKAIDPASEYGKVADLLKEAVKNLSQNQKNPAAKSLDDAAKELAKLGEQLMDAQSLAATLEAMRKAEMALSTGQSMSKFKNTSLCKSCQGGGCKECNGRGWNYGGKFGRPNGVGTWAEETGWLYNSQQNFGPVDNSDIQRPDMDPRGFTDRGEGDLPENLTPSKVKGQLAPGRQMPSITLKGVSIKGQSTVGYQEAATAAQIEAENALNQDQVPRAYQGAVREYFDDLKK